MVTAREEQQYLEKGIGKVVAEQAFRLRLRPDQPANARILRVAIIGLPNSGKSTLTNSLMRWKVSSVSKKVHTTRKNTTAIFTQEDVQIIFLDTPGILDPSRRRRHNLEKSLVIDPERSLQEADVVGVVVDVSNRWSCNELDLLVLQVLHVHRDKTAVLILNKVDLLQAKEMLLQMTRSLTQGVVDGRPVGAMTKKAWQDRQKINLEQMFDAMQARKEKKRGAVGSEEMTETELRENQQTDPHSANTLGDFPLDTRETTPEVEVKEQATQSSNPEHEAWMQYVRKMTEARRAVSGMKGWPHFKRVFMVSALSGEGISEIRDYLLESAQPGDWDYHSSLVTSQDPRELVTLCVKEKLLEHLRQEVPYNMETDIVLMEVDQDGILNVVMNIIARNRRQVTILLGPRGETIQKIASEAKQEIMNAFRCEMRLKLIAKVKPLRRS